MGLGSSISILSYKLDLFLDSTGVTGSFVWPDIFLKLSLSYRSADPSPLERSPLSLYSPRMLVDG